MNNNKIVGTSLNFNLFRLVQLVRVRPSSLILSHHHLSKPNLSSPPPPPLSSTSFCHSSGLSNTNAFQSFGKMPQPHTTNHLHSLLKSTTSAMAPHVAHTFAIKIGALPHLPTATSLLTCYSRAGDFASSLAFFSQTCHKDVVFWNAMLTASIHNRCYGLALDFFVRMIRDGQTAFDSTSLLLALSALTHMNSLKQGRVIHSLSLKSGMILDVNLCNALLDMYAKCCDLSSSEGVFAEMERRDIVSWNSIMSGCFYNGSPEKTLWYFTEMNCSGETADSVNLSCAIAASASLRELSYGEVIHARGFKLGYEDCLYASVSNSLISLYSQCGDIEAAEIVFRGMICKDVVSWNAMIDGFASNGMISESFDLLYEMQLVEAIQPDPVTIVSIAPLCAELMLLREGRAIHGYVVRGLMESHLSVTNSLIVMYSKCNCIEKAKFLFDNVPKRDLISWNAMISGYSQNGHSKEAQELFKELLHWHSHCSLLTLLAILASSDSPEGLHFGRSIHCWELKLGFSNDILAVNSLIHMYICCGDTAAAFSLLQSISSTADLCCWNTVIVGCTQNCHFQEALETFRFMRQEASVSHCDSAIFVNTILACGNLELVSEGQSLHALSLKAVVGIDVRVQNALITMYGRCRDIESASKVFYLSYDHNLCSWNCLISAHSQNKDGRSALELFRYLELEPNEITLVSVLSACTHLGILRHGRQIHGYVLRRGFNRNSFISAALLDMYSNCGRLDIAVQVFRKSQHKTVVAWNSMISAYGFHGNGRKAIDLFDEMLQSGHGATKSTFVSLLSACSHSGLVDVGSSYYSGMFKEYGVKPVTEHHLCVVDMLGRSGRIHDAFDFIKQMQTRPEPGVLGALLSACNYHGDLDTGREVAELLIGLEPRNVGYYISLSNMYITAGRWKDAIELRNIVEEKQLKKPTGYSLIDVSLV